MLMMITTVIIIVMIMMMMMMMTKFGNIYHRRLAPSLCPERLSR